MIRLVTWVRSGGSFDHGSENSVDRRDITAVYPQIRPVDTNARFPSRCRFMVQVFELLSNRTMKMPFRLAGLEPKRIPPRIPPHAVTMSSKAS
jgi:hypothetical protein